MPVMIATRLPISLGHRMTHLGAMTMTTATASSNWSSTLQEASATPTSFKKRAGSVQLIDIAAPPKVILSKEAAAATKEALRRQSMPVSPQPQPAPVIKVTEANNNSTVVKPTADGTDSAWGIFQSRENFQDMHIC